MVDEFKSDSPLQASPDELSSESSKSASSEGSNSESIIKDKEKPTFENIHFAEREIPKDIQLVAQEAMLEQSGADFEEISEEKGEFIEHSAKVSTVRFSENLPKAKKMPVAEDGQNLDGEETTSASKTDEGLKAVANETDSEDKSSVLQSKRLSSSYSFKDEILSRLRAEAESYEAMNEPRQSPAETATSSKKNIIKSEKDSLLDESEKQDQNQLTPETPKDEQKELSEHPHSLDKVLDQSKAQVSESLAETNEPSDMESLVVHEEADSLAETRVFDLKTDKMDTQKLSRSEVASSPRLSRRAERSQTESHKNTPARHATQKSSKIGRSIAAVVVVIFVALGTLTYFYVKASIGAVNPQNTKQKIVNIPNNTSSGGVAQILEKNHLVKNAVLFNYYTKIKGISHFKSGYYNFSESQTADEIAKELNAGGSPTIPALGKITIPEGYSIDQIAEAFTVNVASKQNTKTPFSKNDFLKVVKSPDFIQKMKNKYPKLFANLPSTQSGVKYQLEGYLFPATYDYTADTKAEDIVEQMIATMDKNLTPVYPRLKDLGLNINQLLSLSALVEKEANSEDDRKNVADVFLKRLNENQTLGSNVALLYAEGKFGTNITVNDDKNVDTKLNSPFNLYLNQGVGPGPVDSPSMMSINAVINHAKNDYYYFIADPKTGKLYFAATQEEQDQNINQYLNGK